MADTKRLCFAQDDDCHWYIIPEECRKAFAAWVESDNYGYEKAPFEMRSIDSPEFFSFLDPKDLR